MQTVPNLAVIRRALDANRFMDDDVIIPLVEEVERLRATIARVWSEIDAQPYRHRDAPCTDRCVEAVCDDVRKALEQTTIGIS